MTALAGESKGKLLASPHILVSDNREARIQVGQQVPLISSESYGTTGTSLVQSVQYRDVGIILKVKPQVNESGLVGLELSQEVSRANLTTVFVDSTQYVIDKVEATSNLVVQDGQTIVIGGLIREDNDKTLTGIPYLSKIPLLGYLFGSREKKATRNELIILLTPHVVKNTQDATGVTSDYVDRFTERGNFKKDEMMPLRWRDQYKGQDQGQNQGQNKPDQGAQEKGTTEKGK